MLTLQLEDAGGTKREVIAGAAHHGEIDDDGKTKTLQPSKNKYSVAGGLCAGLRASFAIQQGSDSILGVENWSDAEVGSGTFRNTVVLLPPAAKVVMK